MASLDSRLIYDYYSLWEVAYAHSRHAAKQTERILVKKKKKEVKITTGSTRTF